MPANFVVQDDTGLVANANAYISVAFYRQYHLDRGRDTTATVDTAVQTAIVLATDYIDLRWRLRFAGFLLNPADPTATPPVVAQTTLWPRRCAWLDGAEITGIPLNLQKACAEYALRAVSGPLLVDAPSPIVGGERQPTTGIKQTSTTVGPITTEVQYQDDNGGYGTGTILVNGSLLTVVPAADMLIEPLTGASSIQRRASR